MTQTYYQIQELMTTGWELIEEDARHLTKEQCDSRLQDYLSAGYPPNRLRAIVDV